MIMDLPLPELSGRFFILTDKHAKCPLHLPEKLNEAKYARIGSGILIGSLGGITIMITIFLMLINVLLYGLGVYALILFIKLARRGIQALDIYLYEKRGERF